MTLVVGTSQGKPLLSSIIPPLSSRFSLSFWVFLYLSFSLSLSLSLSLPCRVEVHFRLLFFRIYSNKVLSRDSTDNRQLSAGGVASSAAVHKKHAHCGRLTWMHMWLCTVWNHATPECSKHHVNEVCTKLSALPPSTRVWSCFRRVLARNFRRSMQRSVGSGGCAPGKIFDIRGDSTPLFCAEQPSLPAGERSGWSSGEIRQESYHKMYKSRQCFCRFFPRGDHWVPKHSAWARFKPSPNDHDLWQTHAFPCCHTSSYVQARVAEADQRRGQEGDTSTEKASYFILHIF